MASFRGHGVLGVLLPYVVFSTDVHVRERLVNLSVLSLKRWLSLAEASLNLVKVKSMIGQVMTDV